MDAERWKFLEQTARSLALVEQQVRLVGSAAPANALLEAARITREFSRGRPVALGDAAGTRRDLFETRRTLQRIAAATEVLGPFGLLHAARAAELELEARLVETLGTQDLRALAAERFPAPSAALAHECDAFVRDALAAEVPPSASLHRSEDAGDSRSLVARLRVRARELGLALRIDVRRDQVAAAATGLGIVSVRPSLFLSSDAAERIAEHELLAHALPRARARFAPFALCAVGTRGAGDDEEGRAILIEARSRRLDAERRRALALRHLAALGVREGATLNDTMRRLSELGVPLEPAGELTLRAHRGGGLGRELVYLPAYFTLRSALSAEPGLERWLERGRIDLATARRFASGELEWPSSSPASGPERGLPQPNSIITGV